MTEGIKLSHASIPNISDDFYKRLLATFGPIEIKQTTPINDIMYSAGQQEVLRWIARFRTNAQRS